jgi:hypothetical protein
MAYVQKQFNTMQSINARNTPNFIKILSITLRQETRYVFEKRMARKIFETKKEGAGNPGKAHNKEFIICTLHPILLG